MRVTIVRDDNSVHIDGVSHHVDCSDLPEDFHALQWDGLRGEIEYKTVRCDHCGGKSRKPNDMVTDGTPYQKYVEAWGREHARMQAEAAAAEQERLRITAEHAAAAEAQKAVPDVAGPQS